MFEDTVRRSRSVSLTPLIDVVFLLLIFFMLASTFLQTQALTVLTPGVSSAEQPTDDAVVEVWLLADGTIKVDREPVLAGGLAAALRGVVSARPDIVVSVLAEEGARTQLLVTAVEAARDAGAKTVGTARAERLEP